MTQTEQMKLVLLYAMHEMHGGGRRYLVLRHIQNRGYWYKNDENDARGNHRPSEATWRNDFSFERQHLVDDGYMKDGRNGFWEITEKGETYLAGLMDTARRMLPGEKRLFTLEFYQTFSAIPPFGEGGAVPEEEEEARYIAQMAAEDVAAPIVHSFSNKPQKKRTPRVTGNRIVYPRDPDVAKCALGRANHLCEVDAAHESFLRRNRNVLYMEPHHLLPMAFTDYFGVNLDREQNIFSLCSNCHNKIHYGTKADVRALIAKLFFTRAREICAIIGREIEVEEIYRIYGVSE